jgi:dipeptidase
MQDDYYQPKKSWWDKNWKWFVPTGCLSIIAIIVLFVSVIILGVSSMMKNSDAYKEAMNAAQHNKQVTEKLGALLEKDGMISGNINVSDNTGNCNLEIPIKGSKGTGVLFVVAHKKVKWKFDELSVYINATDEEIDLLKK